MNALQRFTVNLACRIAPPLKDIFEAYGGTVERLAAELREYREATRERMDAGRARAAEFSEALAMAGGGPWLPNPGGTPPGAIALKERLADLELALEDQGYQRLTQGAETEFSRWGILQIILLCRLFFIKNPLVRRGILTVAQYVFGRGVNIASPDKAANDVLQGFLNDPRNQSELGQLGLSRKVVTQYTDGNIFFAFFADPETGAVVVRTIDAIEIDQIVTDPNDSSVPWFYHRRWSQEVFTPSTAVSETKAMDAWYVALGHDPKGTEQIGGKLVMADTTGPIPILHAKFGALPKWKFGCPLAYSAIDWARAYKNLLTDWCSVQHALARFAWQAKTEGGQPAIAALKAKLESAISTTDVVDKNPPPVTGSTFITGPANTLEPIKTAGSHTPPDASRRVMLMVAASFGLPETFFGDASVGTLATAKSLDRPTELLCLMTQEEWREILQTICYYVLDRSRKAPSGRLREAEGTSAQRITVTVDFPNILDHDGESRVNQIVQAMTLDGKPVIGIDEKTGVGLLLSELGVEDVETVIAAMYPDPSYSMDRTAEPEPQPQPQPTQAAIEAHRTAVVASAVKELTRAFEKLAAVNGR